MNPAEVKIEEVRQAWRLADALRGGPSCTDCAWCVYQEDPEQAGCTHPMARKFGDKERYFNWCAVERKNYHSPGQTPISCGPEGRNFKESP